MVLSYAAVILAEKTSEYISLEVFLEGNHKYMENLVILKTRPKNRGRKRELQP